MTFSRTLSSSAGSSVVHVKERISSTLRRDVPFTMCQHVTLGPPFLEKGVTMFDASATRSHTFPGHFEDRPRLKQDAAFTWPDAPGAKGETVDMRQMARTYRVSSDFSTQLMDPRQDDAWFSAVNPAKGLLVAYVWQRGDFPWLGNWEENYGRKSAPWSGKTLSRGMEFANTPYPTNLQDAVARGRYQGQPTFRWLPARKSITVDYDIIALPAPRQATGVESITRRKSGFDVGVML
jgi:hypothetical protein